MNLFEHDLYLKTKMEFKYRIKLYLKIQME